MRWTDTGLLDLNFLDPLLANRTPDNCPPVLRAGACWSMPDGSILEYLGRLEAAEGPPHMFRRWICPPGSRPGATLHLCETTPARGAGSDLLLHYDDVWPLAQATRAILRQDDSHPRKQKDATRTLVREFPQLAPLAATVTAYTQTPAEEIVFWLSENDFTEGEFEIFTDGS